MDLRAYYKKIREAEALLTGESMVVVSVATPEGGREGVRTEAPRKVAAKLLAEGRARLATEQETLEFYEANRAAREKFEQDEAAKRVQVMVIPSRAISGSRKSGVEDGPLR
jgi:hypothetical protein